MQLSSLSKKIISLGGTSKITTEILQNGQEYTSLTGRIGKYTVRMFTEGFYTLTKDGTEYDHGSDYNPSGAIFFNRIKDIERYAQA